jgi:hypothetical protein
LDKEKESNSFEDSLFWLTSGSFIPDRLHLFLPEDEKNYRDSLSSKTEAIIAHEYFHFIQTAMTGYGQLAWSIYRQAMGEVLNDWLNLTNNNPTKRPLPLGHFFKKSEINKYSAIFINAKIRELLTPYKLRNYVYPSFGDNLKNYELFLIKEPWQVIPYITHKNEIYHLNGIDIIESHAKYLEAFYSFIFNKTPIHETIYNAPKRYWFAFDWFINEVGFERIFEFPIICDLALQISWNYPPKTEFEWRSSHPAWRFIYLIDNLKKNVNAPLSLEKIKENYLDYCNCLLDGCSFLSLNEVLNKLLEQYQGRDVLELERFMRDTITFRKKCLWCGANPLLDIEVWMDIKKRFPPPSIQFGNQLNVSLTNYNNNQLLLETIGELHLQALSNQILGIISQYSTNIEEMQCGYSYYGIKEGCYFQRSDNCCGSFKPENGLPIKTVIEGDEVTGCQFGAMLNIYGLSIENIDLDFTSKLSYEFIKDLKE